LVKPITITRSYNKTVFQSKADHPRMCVLLYDLDLYDLDLEPMTLIVDVDLDVLNSTCLYIKPSKS